MRCSLLPWIEAGRRRYTKKEQFDIVLFADGIYTERGGLLLADAVTAVLRPTGLLIGALPDLRAGMNSFEEDLEVRGLVSVSATLKQEVVAAASRSYDEDVRGLVAGGSAKEYRIMLWRYAAYAQKVQKSKVDGETSPTMQSVVPKDKVAFGTDDPAGGDSSRSLRNLSWPRGYALCIFSPTNPIRRLCKGILSFEVRIQGDRFKVFDNAILVCILVSCIGMASDSPLADPKATLTQVIRGGDYLFAVLFGAEMVIKLIAFGLIWSQNAYLKDGWNILDGVVVIVSIVDLAVDGGGGFLKGVRILRAFRPLRIISRNQNLRVVAQTIFASLQDLLSLMVVAALFLLIFALFACSFLSGRMYHCSVETSVVLLRDIADFRTPLCLGSSNDSQSVVSGSCNNGAAQNSAWVENNCASCSSSLNVEWVRATVDTPICIGRCDPSTSPDEEQTSKPPEWLCPKPLTSAQQLPSVCDGSDTAEYLSNMTAAEQEGRQYMQAMSRMLVIPCGGSTVNASESSASAPVVSCREAFCPEGVSSELAEQCQSNCRRHPFFCKDTCEANELSGECQSCRRECEAACECRHFCEPWIKDAALCVEQGGRWQQALSQDFDNVFSSMLTLFEISSTEGWADVMYAACDSVDHFIEPIRNYSEWIFAPFFVVYMIFSHMFIINLSVGVIVDKFMDLKQSGKRDIVLTIAQVKWLENQKLLTRTRFFDMRDLDLMPPLQRKAYDIISSFRFTTFILVAIALNSALMAMQTFPSQIEWWDDVMYVGKRCFSGIFTLEMMVKLYALRSSYWEDRLMELLRLLLCCCVSAWNHSGGHHHVKRHGRHICLPRPTTFPFDEIPERCEKDFCRTCCVSPKIGECHGHLAAPLNIVQHLGGQLILHFEVFF
eukprot:symbB.v1.2.023384.t1/scaffold2106.1/size89218/3